VIVTPARVNPLHGYYSPDHLIHVLGEMRRLGPPVLRAAWDDQDGVWHAREGTHRLRAALALGVAPILVRVPWKRTHDARARVAALRYAHSFPMVRVMDGKQGLDHDE
jgi:hypothetical protein